MSKRPDVADRAQAYGIPARWSTAWTCWRCARQWRRRLSARAAAPAQPLIEAKTCYYGHSHSDPRAYRTREEEADWRRRDPIAAFAARLAELRLLADAEQAELEQAADAKLATALAFSEASPAPDPAELETDVYATQAHRPPAIAAERALREHVRADASVRQISYAQALTEAMREECAATIGCSCSAKTSGCTAGRMAPRARPARRVRPMARDRHADLQEPRSLARAWVRQWLACGR